MGEVLETRRSKTNARFKEIKAELSKAEKIVANRACVYATGSFGRGEASMYSDLDLFIVGLGQKKPKLSRLQQICLEADLISATQRPCVSARIELVRKPFLQTWCNRSGDRSPFVSAGSGYGIGSSIPSSSFHWMRPYSSAWVESVGNSRLSAIAATSAARNASHRTSRPGPLGGHTLNLRFLKQRRPIRFEPFLGHFVCPFGKAYAVTIC